MCTRFSIYFLVSRDDDSILRRKPMADVTNVSDENFDTEVLQSELPVLLDLWAPWCGPCKAIAPTVEALAGEYDGKLKVVKLNVDDNPKTPANYNVRGIPNLILFKGGEVQEQIVGAVPRAKLEAAIKNLV
jgi:thioredoxin 1